MPFDSASTTDASLQRGEYLELWESTRFSQRQDPLGGDNPQNYRSIHLVQEGNGQNLDLPRNHELGASPQSTVEDIEGRGQPANDPENENRNLLEDQRSSNIRASGPPAWLSTALLGQPNQSLHDGVNADQCEREKWCPGCSACGQQSCVCSSSVHAGDTNATSFLNHTTYTHWLSVQSTGTHAGDSQHRSGEFGGADDFSIHRQQTQMVTELNLTAAHGRDAQPFLESLNHPLVAAPRYVGEYSRGDWDTTRQDTEWEELRKRSLIVNHPLYSDMLLKHVACLRVGTPIEQLPYIEAQLSDGPIVIQKYKVLGDQIADISREEQAELDHFMTQYPYILSNFSEVLQNHVFSDVTEAMMSCWQLEQELFALTGNGVRPTEGSGATMSDDDVDEYDSDYGAYEQGIDYHDSGGYGPLVPSESERTLMERMRQELKHELKQGYKSKIEDVREEILRKRRAGKLPDGTTTVLKAWWQAHAKWPYPTEDEKELLIKETGLELKQVNNWFINQRKRNWHNNPLINSQSDLKNKVRKR
ncbi:hypothetical protein M758_3G077700 [Ceratodon purpureus]|nr:hypothetical protein M758_3G077700 [Ceratodon purpureus]